MSGIINEFDLDSAQREAALKLDGEFDRCMTAAGTSFMQACKAVQSMHCLLCRKRPGFVAWAESKAWGFSVRTAYRMIGIAERFSEIRHTASSQSALYLLCERSSSDEARAEAARRMEAGEFLTVADARKIVERSIPASETAFRYAEEMSKGPRDDEKAAAWQYAAKLKTEEDRREQAILAAILAFVEENGSIGSLNAPDAARAIRRAVS